MGIFSEDSVLLLEIEKNYHFFVHSLEPNVDIVNCVHKNGSLIEIKQVNISIISIKMEKTTKANKKDATKKTIITYLPKKRRKTQRFSLFI